MKNILRGLLLMMLGALLGCATPAVNQSNRKIATNTGYIYPHEISTIITQALSNATTELSGGKPRFKAQVFLNALPDAMDYLAAPIADRIYSAKVASAVQMSVEYLNDQIAKGQIPANSQEQIKKDLALISASEENAVRFVVGVSKDLIEERLTR